MGLWCTSASLVTLVIRRTIQYPVQIISYTVAAAQNQGNGAPLAMLAKSVASHLEAPLQSLVS